MTMPGVYLSPGVYVEEVPSAVQAIVGVGTSTAGFIGSVPDQIEIPRRIYGERFMPAAGDPNTFTLAHSPVATEAGTYEVWVGGQLDQGATLANANGTSTLTTVLPNERVVVSYLFRSVHHTRRRHRRCAPTWRVRKFFGDFAEPPHTLARCKLLRQRQRCCVVRITDATQVEASDVFGVVDEIALVAAPGVTDGAIGRDRCAPCQDETAFIFDSLEVVEDDDGFLDLTLLDHPTANILPQPDYAGFFPGSRFDPPESDVPLQQRPHLPPWSHRGHLRPRRRQPGRVQALRRGHRAASLYIITRRSRMAEPARSTIRDLNGNIRVWGVSRRRKCHRWWRYINVRRTMLSASRRGCSGRSSSEHLNLWAKLPQRLGVPTPVAARHVVGSTPQEAFYVKCDGRPTCRARSARW
jgi:hypothetical protein